MQHVHYNPKVSFQHQVTKASRLEVAYRHAIRAFVRPIRVSDVAVAGSLLGTADRCGSCVETLADGGRRLRSFVSVTLMDALGFLPIGQVDM